MSARLRNGSEVSDRRLGRIPAWDLNNSKYPLQLLGPLADREPRSYTHSCYFQNGYQNGWSGCVGWTVAKEAAARPVVVPGIDDKVALDWYFRIQDTDEWAGSERPGDLNPIGGTSIGAAARFMRAQGHWANYLWPRNVREAATAVSWNGPVPVGVMWKTGCMNVDSKGYVNLTGQDEGGHAFLLRGYHLRGPWAHTFLCTNHWRRKGSPWGLIGDEGWGEPGDFYVHEDTLAEWMAGDAEVVAPTRKKVKV